MNENPALVAVMIVVAGYVFSLWWGDLRAARDNRPNPRAFPGATPCPGHMIVVAIAGTLLLLGLETGGEAVLGISDEQKTVTVLWSVYTLAAAFLEELAFRGYLVFANRGRAVLWAGIAGFSLLFALMHPFLWEWADGHLVLHLTTKAWFSTAMVFAGSLWFYSLRFVPANPGRSLLPCIAAHLTKNVGVFVIKAIGGFVTALY